MCQGWAVSMPARWPYDGAEGRQNPMAEAWKLSIKQWVLEATDTAAELAKKAAKQAQEASDVASKTYHESRLKHTVEETATWTKEHLDKTGVTEIASRVADTVGEEFDKISGKKILELVEERLALQARYNDILASKLDEALQRITALEAHQSEGDHA
jgi:hypothetical protein